MFANCEITKTAFGTDNEVLMRYISENLGGTIPYRYQQTENRIIKTDGKTPDVKNSDDIVILHTNDVHCGVTDTIGYDGLMLYKKQLQKKYENVLLVDAGDHIQGGTIGLLTHGKAIIEIMNKLKYDVVTLGNHEFDYKIPELW